MAEELYFGGSFNPPHAAHTACGAAASIACGLTGVVLVPSKAPNLKDPADVAPAADRLAMTRLAAEAASSVTGVPFRVDGLELTRAGMTYTVDTVADLHTQGVTTVNWLIGADQLLNLHRWHRFDDLLRLTRFRVMARPGYAIDWDAVHPSARGLRADVVVVPQMDVSATDIRRRLRTGESVDGLVVPAVRDYLRTHRLYMDSRGR